MGTPLDRGMAHHAREFIKDMIDLLDQLEADPDLEPTAGDSASDECEPAEDAEYSGDEHEPSLGACENHPTSPWHGQPNLPLRYDNSGGQQLWARSGTDDLEEEHDGREPDLCA
ncbi:hypothetical protein [Bradyrhizobium sp. SEMIA]|uniref:hypothetical protein n=1 Tax=Bradyrhizobium sp. SEMIA TaxID=2597515 RepID=UPI0018A58A30|nr:hypothetical protein [Bradyrhizobium sp. SEMIA]QOG17922.1 hypothetical protein FOM02_11785 [Bradyrhizobium sp. SEMIA]